MPGIAWTAAELRILTDTFPVEGAQACVDRLPGRGLLAIKQRARKAGLKDPTLPPPAALRQPLAGQDLDRALELRDAGWSYARIGKACGVCESTATNALMIVQCRRAGYTPARRDALGSLLPAEIERLRAMMRAGLRGTDIQIRMGISASCVSNQRRRYAAELKKRRMQPLPPPGRGEAYSGRKLPKETRQQIVDLLMTGLGAPKIALSTGVSKSHIQRIRRRLIARLRRRGETLPGCDYKGVRHEQFGSAARIPAEAIAELRRRILDGEPVARAAKAVGIGGSSAYRIRDALANELRAEGKLLAKPIRLGRAGDAKAARAADWLPPNMFRRYRRLCHHVGAEQARAIVEQEIAAAQIEVARRLAEERARPLTFEEKLARVRRGAPIAAVPVIRKPDPIAFAGNALGDIA